MTVNSKVLILAGMTLIMGFVIILFIYQTFRKNRRDHVLTFGFIVGWLALLALTIRETGVATSIAVPNFIGGVAFSLLFFSLYLHYEFISRPTPHFWRFGYMCGLLGMRLVTVSLHALLPDNVLVAAFYYPSFDLIRMSAFIFALHVTWHVWRLTGDWESALEMLASALVLVGGVFGIIHRPIDVGMVNPETVILGIPLDVMLVISYLFTFVGIFVYLLVFIINPDYLYRLPVPLHHVIIYNEAGMALYSRSIRSKGIKTVEIADQLFSGAISAISSLLSESAHRQISLQWINSSVQSVVFEHHPAGISALLVCDNPTYFVRLSLRRFLNMIPTETLKNMTASALVNASLFKADLDALIQAAFPYVEFQER